MLNFDSAGGRVQPFLLFVCMSAILIPGQTYAADENKQKPSESATVKSRLFNPYCGLYCLYSTMKLSKKEIDINKLIKPEYFSSSKGSSLEDLKKAAEDNGMYAAFVSRMTTRILRQCPYQTILHVKSDVASKKYDHYELFLGTENGKAKLFDPPEPVRLVPFKELAPRWDGNGLVISDRSIDIGAMFSPVWERIMMYAAISMVTVLVIHWAQRCFLIPLVP